METEASRVGVARYGECACGAQSTREPQPAHARRNQRRASMLLVQTVRSVWGNAFDLAAPEDEGGETSASEMMLSIAVHSGTSIRNVSTSVLYQHTHTARQYQHGVLAPDLGRLERGRGGHCRGARRPSLLGTYAGSPRTYAVGQPPGPYRRRPVPSPPRYGTPPYCPLRTVPRKSVLDTA
eukprot:626875-Rhodomonas_salina.1